MARLGPLVATLLALFGAPAVAQDAATTRRIIVVPPTQWDSLVANFRPGYRQTVTDFANLTGGVVFGLKPREVVALMPQSAQGIAWADLPLAPEFPEDVRYFWTRLPTEGPLNAGITGCVGQSSYLVMLFRARGLFRMSYRMIPDATCPSVATAATDVMAYYARIDPEIALAMHYRNGTAEVVDVVDPGAGYLRDIRWRQRRR